MTGKQILLGKIVAAHGLKGEVKIKSFTADPLDIAAYGMVTVPDGRRFHLERPRVQGDTVIAGIRGISDRNAAEALKGLELHVERDDLPDDDKDESSDWSHMLSLAQSRREQAAQRLKEVDEQLQVRCVA